MRRWLPLFAAPLAASCGSPDGTQAQKPEDMVECATEGAAAFERVCTIERQGPILTVRSPSGSFRRLLVAEDGGIAAADGAEPAIVTPMADNHIEVRIGGDRYRLPATVR